MVSNESLKLVEEGNFISSGLSGVSVFSGESSAHVDGVVKSGLVSGLLSGSRCLDTSFSLEGNNEGIDVVIQSLDCIVQTVEDNVVFSNGFIISSLSIGFVLDEGGSSFVEVFSQLIEESGESVDGVLANTNCGGSEEFSEDGGELDSLLGLDHLDERLVDVVSDLDE